MRPAVALLLVASGCAHTLAELPARERFETKLGAFELASATTGDVDTARVKTAVERSVSSLARWGRLTAPVTIWVLPSHRFLGDVVGHRWGWLRAWAQYDRVLLQGPRSWAGGAPDDAFLTELLTHELTHCLMFQRAATADDWTGRKIPLWFREGMASWTANQAYRYAKLEELTAWLDAHPGADPVLRPEGLYEEGNGLVYGAALHAFTFLFGTHGEENVHRILDRLKAGALFADAFASVLGKTEAAFVEEFWAHARKTRATASPTGSAAAAGDPSLPPPAAARSPAAASPAPP